MKGGERERVKSPLKLCATVFVWCTQSQEEKNIQTETTYIKNQNAEQYLNGCFKLLISNKCRDVDGGKCSNRMGILHIQHTYLNVKDINILLRLCIT